jgi:hypothetical protein
MIWCFGDSNTEGYNLEYQWVRDYSKYKGYTPTWWTETLSQKLNQPLTNLGVGGTDNYTIFDSIIKVLHKIQPEDTLIIGWSSILRGRAVLNDYLTPLLIEMLPKIPDFSERSLQEMLVNRNSERYVEEVLGWNKIIQRAFNKNTIIFWSPFPEFRGKIMFSNLRFRPDSSSMYSIEDETKGKVKDSHPSETGNGLIAGIFYEYLAKGKRLI